MIQRLAPSFRQHMLMVADPDMLKEILVKDFSKFHDRKVS